MLWFSGLLRWLGFHLNQEKSSTEPAQCIPWLGHSINSLSLRISLSPKLLDFYREHLCGQEGWPAMSARKAASLLGKLNAAYSIHPSVVSYIRPWQRLLTSRRFISEVCLNMGTLSNAAFWVSRSVPWPSVETSVSIFFDASESGIAVLFSRCWLALCPYTFII